MIKDVFDTIAKNARWVTHDPLASVRGGTSQIKSELSGLLGAHKGNRFPRGRSNDCLLSYTLYGRSVSTVERLPPYGCSTAVRVSSCTLGVVNGYFENFAVGIVFQRTLTASFNFLATTGTPHRATLQAGPILGNPSFLALWNEGQSVDTSVTEAWENGDKLS